MKANWRQTEGMPWGYADKVGLDEFRAALCWKRGLESAADISAFVSHSPVFVCPFDIPDMSAAVDLVMARMDRGERVGLFGDFDVDGVSGLATLAEGIERLGGRTVARIPDRARDGHGLGEEALKGFAGDGVDLVLTVDCSFAGDGAESAAAALGVNVVVTDHHQVSKDSWGERLLVNPQRPDYDGFKGLTGSGVAYRVAQALSEARGRDEPEDLLQLAALGTVGDVGPLVGENRDFVIRGLEGMNESRRVGIAAIAEAAGLGDRKFDAATLAYQIIPRLNAPGRLGDAGLSLSLLRCEGKSRASRLAKRIDEINKRRRELTESGVEEAVRQVECRYGGALPGILMVGSRTWGHGVIGLIASRLAEMYGRMAVAVVIEGDRVRGSARGVRGVSIYGELSARAELFDAYGGHEGAGGFSLPVESIAALASSFEEAVAPDEGDPVVKFDLWAEPAVVERELGFIDSLAPFGEANPEPVFCDRLVVGNLRRVGNDGAHLKMELVDVEARRWDAIGFRMGEMAGRIASGGLVDALYSMEINEWRGRVTTQLRLVDLQAV